nr:myrosinase 1-like [Onthophagus taurus]
MESKKMLTMFFILLISTSVSCVNLFNMTFPESFKFGVATSAYQVEGGWKESGKGESVWDRFTHQKPHKIKDHSNGDTACDSYKKFYEDIQHMKELKVDFYKFSISWSRILPNGHISLVNVDGVRYYNEIIDELLLHGIKPIVTLFHWDLPQPLQEKGGWSNDNLITTFEEYANLLFSIYGNRVDDWVTFDDPFTLCFDNYFLNTSFGTSLIEYGNSGFLCAQTVLKAHARVYKLYDTRYKEKQGGRIGISLLSTWMEPTTQSESDNTISELAMEIELGWFAHPIFSKEGGYPKTVCKQLKYFNDENQMKYFKVPELTPEELEMVKGSSDFFGLNHFVTKICNSSIQKVTEHNQALVGPDFCSVGVQTYNGTISPLKTVPWGLRKVLNWIKKEYNNPEVLITANGFPDSGERRDCERVRYINSYLENLLAAMHMDGCNVTGYTIWSLLDNFDWYHGYTQKYGLYHVDFASWEKTRTAKFSSHVYRNIIETRKVNWTYSQKDFIMCKYGFAILNDTETDTEIIAK